MGIGRTAIPPNLLLRRGRDAKRPEPIASLSDLQLYTQVNNILNRQPPLATGASAFGTANGYGGTNPIFYDTLGLACRVGFRMSF